MLTANLSLHLTGNLLFGVILFLIQKYILSTTSTQKRRKKKKKGEKNLFLLWVICFQVLLSLMLQYLYYFCWTSQLNHPVLRIIIVKLMIMAKHTCRSTERTKVNLSHDDDVQQVLWTEVSSWEISPAGSQLPLWGPQPPSSRTHPSILWRPGWLAFTGSTKHSSHSLQSRKGQET